MTKTEVLALLDQPSWAVTSDDASDLAEPDIPLTLIWRNGNCNPVMVNFDSAGRVTGKDEGRALCGGEEYTFLPEDEFAHGLPVNKEAPRTRLSSARHR
jgi:hypothetical protein